MVTIILHKFNNQPHHDITQSMVKKITTGDRSLKSILKQNITEEILSVLNSSGVIIPNGINWSRR